MSFREVKAFKELLASDELIMFDTETTGLSAAECDIIEFSALKAKMDSDGRLVTTDTLDVYINPGYPLPEKIVEITGITDSELSEKGITADAAFEKIKAFFGSAPIISGYNVKFDIGFVEALYSKFGENFKYKSSLDVMAIAKEKLPKPHKLINVCEKLGIAEGFVFHRSIDDATATLCALNNLLPLYSEENTEKMEVTGVTRWTKHGYDRIYINNRQNVSAYYDVNTDTWSINGDYELEDVKASVYAITGVSSDDQLKTAV